MAAKKKNTDYYFEELKKIQFKKEVIGIIVLAIAFFLYLGNKYVLSTGIIGQFVFGHVLDAVIGKGKYVLPHFFAVTGLVILFGSNFTREKTRVPGITYGFIVYLMTLELQYGMVTSEFHLRPIGSHAGGIIGYCLTFVFKSFFGFHGLKIILISSVLISLLMIFNLTLLEVLTLVINSVQNGVDLFFNSIQKMNKQKKTKTKTVSEKKTRIGRKETVKKEIKQKPEPVKPLRISVKKEEKDEEQLSALDLHRIERVESQYEDFMLPDLKLLSEMKVVAKDRVKKMEGEMNITIQKLEETLESFKVNARVVSTSQGPTVTRYELQPGFGVKVSKIVNLSDDIALNLAAKGVRIEAPVPGKSVVGIEIPNKESQIITMMPLAKDERFIFSASPLFIALGKDLEGKSVYADITKMPHMLIAGATGSGKSVCVNSILISILLRNTPNTVRMILIDPKKVELNVYDDIPHLIAPVVTDAKKAAVTLRWCVREMERRYEEMAALGVRNIDGYNKRIAEIMEERDNLPEEEQNEFFVPRKHPYIVVVIDELADLMLAAAAEVETSIARIAQMARAVGLHLIIATQRPSVDVITGLIKANIPSRISFAVSSQIDSRTILDGMGAEKLLGKGDMLYKPVGSMRATRIQGVYISDKEVHSIVKFVKSQGKPEYLQEVVDLKAEDLKDLKKSSKEASQDDFDEFYEDAKELIIQNKVASISYIQRKLRIGYNRAARIMDQMEEAGIVSAPDAEGKGRKVLF